MEFYFSPKFLFFLLLVFAFVALKGCFHVPRGLYQGWQTLERIAKPEV